MKSLEKNAPRIVWNLGLWVVGPAAQDPEMASAMASLHAEIFNRRAPPGSHNQGPFGLPALDWMGLVQGLGVGIEVERRGTKALQWGRFHASDAINTLRLLKLAPGSSVVAAAWSPKSVVEASVSSRISVCAYVLVSGPSGDFKKNLMTFPSSLASGLATSSQSADEVVASCLTACLGELNHSTDSTGLQSWLAFHKAARLEERLSLPPAIAIPSLRF